MHVISRDNPCFYFTSVTVQRLPVFRTDELKIVVCNALDEARNSGGFSLYAYVVMLDHLHVITDSPRKPSDILRYINGIISRRVINHLKDQGHERSLLKLRHETKNRGYKYSLWDHHSNTRVLMTEKMLMERVHYTHNNPVRAGMVDRAGDYRWSSIRCWNGNPLEDEPLLMNLDRIKWRSR